jgi:hypothetical protein
MKMPSKLVIVLLTATFPSLGGAADKVVSLNFHRGTNGQVTQAFGAEVLGAVAGSWNNYDNVATGTNVLGADGVATTVDWTGTNFYQFTADYPGNVDYAVPTGTYNGMCLRSGPPTKDAATGGLPITVALSDLSATFPNGYKLAVFLTGKSDNAGASISDGTTTYYYTNYDAGAAFKNQRVTTDTNSGDGIDKRNLAIFGSDASPLTTDSVTLTLTALSSGVAAIGGIQIVSANPAGRVNPPRIISANLYSGPSLTQTIETSKTWGLDADGSPANTPNWNNLRYTVDNGTGGASGVPLRFSNGTFSTVVFKPSDLDGTGTYDGTWGSENTGGGGTIVNDTPFLAGRFAFAANPKLQWDVTNLKANFPFGYRIIVFFAGYNTNNKASIKLSTVSGATETPVQTYYFQIEFPLSTPFRRATSTVDPGVGAGTAAEYAVFGDTTPLTSDTVRLELQTYDTGAVAFGGIQIIGNEVDVSMALRDSNLELSVGNVPPGLTLEVQNSTNLGSGFAPLSTPLKFNSATSQPMSIPVNTATTPRRFFIITKETSP